MSFQDFRILFWKIILDLGSLELMLLLSYP